MKTPGRLSLARLPTPIHRLKNTSHELKKEVYIWRDDLTGFIDSGNKIRKLEFLVADALAKGCDHLVTCGGPQSNHTRATSAVARSLGLGVSILILPKANFDFTKAPTGNLLLNQLFDARITWIDLKEYFSLGSIYTPFFEREVEKLKQEGKKPYVIPLGGSNGIGCFGYIAGIEEMLPTWKHAVPNSQAPDSLFCALGSGGTFVGLNAGIQKQKLSTQLYGVNVIGALEIAKNYVANVIEDAKQIGLSISQENSHMIDGYVGEGYASASDADLMFYRALAKSEGIILDPCYTGKAFQGMIAEIKRNPSRFGEKILFLHSGGGFGNFAYTEQYQGVFQQKT